MDRVAAYNRKAAMVQAIQFNGVNIEDIREFVSKRLVAFKSSSGMLYVNTPYGMVVVHTGEFICKDENNDIYPVKEQLFYKNYEVINGSHTV